MACTLPSLLSVLTGQAPPPALLAYTGSLDPQEFSKLVQALKVSQYTGGLRLKGCELGDRGAKALATALCDNSKLQELELPGNNIGEDGAAELCRMLDYNRSLTDLDLEGNPCAESAPDVIVAIQASIQRNRNLSSGPSSRETTPRPMDFRSNQNRLRIVEVSPDTPAGIVSPTGAPGNVAAAKALFASSPNGMDRASSTTEFEGECRQLEERQLALESAVEQLECQADEAHKWQRQMDVASDRAAALMSDHDKALKQVKGNLDELEDWRGQHDQIMNNFTVMIQRQNGEVKALKDKVLRLDNQADRAAWRHSLTSEAGTPGWGTPSKIPDPPTPPAAPLPASGAQIVDIMEELRTLRDKQAGLSQLPQLVSDMTAQQTQQGKEVHSLKEHFQILEASHADTSRLEAQVIALKADAATNNSVVELQGQLDSLKQRFQDLEASHADMSRLEGQLDALKAGAVTNNAVQEIQGQLDSLKQHFQILETSQADMAQLEAQLVALKADSATHTVVADLQGGLAALRGVTGALTELEGRISRLEAGSGDLWKLQEMVMKFSAHSKEIAQLQEQSEDIQATMTQITQVQGQILELQERSSDLPTLRRKVQDLEANNISAQETRALVAEISTMQANIRQRLPTEASKFASACIWPVSHPLTVEWFTEEEDPRMAALQLALSEQQAYIARLQEDVLALKAGTTANSGGQENVASLLVNRTNTAHKTPGEFKSPQITSALVPLHH